MAINIPGIPNGGFPTSPPPSTTAPTVSPPVTPTTPTGFGTGNNLLTSSNPFYAQYNNTDMAKWLQVNNQPAGSWAAGMMYGGSPLSAEDAATLNRVAAEPANPTWFNSNSMTNAMANGNLVPNVGGHITMANLNGVTGVGTGNGIATNGGPITPPHINPPNPMINPVITGSSYGAGYTGYGNINLSGTPGVSASDSNPTGAGPQGQAPGTAGSFVAGPPTVTTPNTNASALPQATTNPAGTSGRGSFISTSVPKPQVRTNVVAGGNPNFNEFRPPTMANIGQASLRYPNLVNRTR